MKSNFRPVRKNKTKNIQKNILIIFAIVSFALSAILIIGDKNLHSDESAHLDQINLFHKGQLTLNPILTTIPGYHLLIATLSETISQPSLAYYRLLTTLLSLISIIVFYITAKKIDSKNKENTLLQYIFLPILFPFFFLLYTDALSLTLVILSFLFVLNKKYDLSAIASLSSILVRQNNIVWSLFLFTLIYFQENRKIKFKNIISHLKNNFIYLITFFLFAVFIILNKGIAIGDKQAHPAGIFNLGNIYFILFIFAIIFLPFNLYKSKEIFKKINKNKKILVYILICLAFYLLTFKNTHPYNQSGYDFFLRNKILLFFTSSLLLKALFFIPIAYSCFSLSVTKLKNKNLYLLYPFTILYLLPSWLIEQRYYLIPFAFFILFAKRESKKEQYATIIYFIILSSAFIIGIRNNYFFL